MDRRNFLGKSAITGLLAASSASTAFGGCLTETKSDYKKFKVAVDADVLVCGGGCSGVIAAISAARHGASVVLIERLPTVGGMATNGLVNIWHTSDREKVVILGLVNESVERAIKENWLSKYSTFPHSHETYSFKPEGMRIVWQRMLREAGVRTFCHLAAGEPIVEDNSIKGILADTMTGRKEFLGKIVIDSTGDGSIAANAGLPFSFGRESDGLVQGMTMCFELRGIDEVVLKAIPKKEMDELLKEMERMAIEGKLPPYNIGNTGGHLRNARNFMIWNMCPANGNPTDEEELTFLTEQSRERILKYLEFWRKNVPGMEKAEINITATSLGVRESRRIQGLKTLTREMVLGAEKQPDAIGHGVWMIDIHDPKGSGYTTHSDRTERIMVKAGTSYHIPLGIALNSQIPNLAVSCRAASTTHEGLSSFRVQSHLMALSQGVGTCAAIALDSNTSMQNVNIIKLQQTLKADGVYLEDVPKV